MYTKSRGFLLAGLAYPGIVAYSFIVMALASGEIGFSRPLVFIF